MNKPVQRVARSVCPHDCPSTCALDVDVIDGQTIGRVRGAKDDPYTAGVICEKVARYAERIHHPNRLLYPLRRAGKKGEGRWERISWDDALDEVATRFLQAERDFGTESVWPYFYAGTMGHVQRDSIDRLRNAKRYSRQYDTICTTPAWGGYIAGTGLLGGVNPEEMADADCVVIWGTNAVFTQVNVMTHAMRARRRGAKVVVIDIYRTATMEQADLGLVIRPGSDGALACAVMHVLLRDGYADRDYLARMTDFDAEVEAHLKGRTPAWASEITGLPADQIEAFARLVGENTATYFRLGYGFTRQNNGATNMHAALCIAAITGAWNVKGGGAFHSNSGTWKLDKSAIEGVETDTRQLDMSEIGPILTGNARALRNGPQVKAMLVQNTNPACVAPEQALVIEGFKREDLFVVVHEQFMTETAELADIVLPATMFLEHEDYYTRGGHTRILYGPQVVDAPGEARSNTFVINALAKRLGLEDSSAFDHSDAELVETTLARSGLGTIEQFRETGFIDRARPEDDAHFRSGFGWPDRRFRFRANWAATAALRGYLLAADPNELPVMPDHWDVNEATDAEHPFKLATSPARAFLNSSFNETPGSQKREGPPSLRLHPEDAAALGIGEGEFVEIGNRRGAVTLTARLFDGLCRGVVIAESLHPNKAHTRGRGINTLTNAKPVAPYGGAAFHDVAVWVRPVES